MQLVQVMFVGGSGYERMGETAFGIHANMGFHSEVPFVAFLGLMPLWVTLIVFILSGARGFDYGGIDQRSLRHHDATVRQPLVNGFE